MNAANKLKYFPNMKVGKAILFPEKPLWIKDAAFPYFIARNNSRQIVLNLDKKRCVKQVIVHYDWFFTEAILCLPAPKIVVSLSAPNVTKQTRTELKIV